MRVLITILLLISWTTLFSQSFTLSGQIRNCYEDMFDRLNKLEPLIKDVTLTSLDNVGQEEKVATDSTGKFVFKGKSAGKWKIQVQSFSFYPMVDTLLIVNRDMIDIILCTDWAFRPLSESITKDITKKAKEDLKNRKAKFYFFMPSTLTLDQATVDKENQETKKYGFGYVTVTNSIENKTEADTFLQRQEYNKQIELLLDKKYGKNWRQTLKHGK